MKRLSHSDWAAISDVLPTFYAERNLDDLSRVWVRTMRQLVSADLIGMLQFKLPSVIPIKALSDPSDPEVEKLAPVYMELGMKIPELYSGATKGIRKDFSIGTIAPITTRIPQSRFERTDLFNAFHRPLGLRYQLGGYIDAVNPTTGFVINRRHRDYSQRDVEVLRHVTQHYAAAVRNVREFTNLSNENSALLNANKMEGRGVVFLTMDGELRWMTPLASELFAKFFEHWRNKSHLPDDVARWLREQRIKLAEGRAISSPIEPLVIRREQRRLAIYLAVSAVSPPMLVLKENAQELSVAMLGGFGLTPRETEVLYWLIQGKTNAEIAILLGAREGTIRKHVEHVLTHFGTPNRTATVLQVIEQLAAR